MKTIPKLLCRFLGITLLGCFGTPWSDTQPEQPVAWVRDLPGRGRVFYTSLGHPDDFRQEEFQALLANATRWALGRKGGKL